MLLSEYCRRVPTLTARRNVSCNEGGMSMHSFSQGQDNYTERALRGSSNPHLSKSRTTDLQALKKMKRSSTTASLAGLWQNFEEEEREPTWFEKAKSRFSLRTSRSSTRACASMRSSSGVWATLDS